MAACVCGFQFFSGVDRHAAECPISVLTKEKDALVLQINAMVSENEKMMLERNGFAEKAAAANRLNGELQKELAELRHTGQHMTCGQCEQLRETQKRNDEAKPSTAWKEHWLRVARFLASYTLGGGPAYADGWKDAQKNIEERVSMQDHEPYSR